MAEALPFLRVESYDRYRGGFSCEPPLFMLKVFLIVIGVIGGLLYFHRMEDTFADMV